MCFIFPLVGWITELRRKATKTCENPKKRKHRITTIGATMATLTGLVMTIIYYVFICTADPHRFIADGVTFSSRAFVVHLVPLIMFSCFPLPDGLSVSPEETSPKMTVHSSQK